MLRDQYDLKKRYGIIQSSAAPVSIGTADANARSSSGDTIHLRRRALSFSGEVKSSDDCRRLLAAELGE